MIEQLALGIQKPTGKTNLGEETVALLSAGGLQWRLPERVDFAPTNIKQLEIVAMRNGDLTRACARGEIDLAIVGMDKYWDYTGFNKPAIVKSLGYSQCSLKLGVLSTFPYKELEDLDGQTIATSYGRGSDRWFKDQGISVRILDYEGGEELGPGRKERTRAVGCIAISYSGTSMEQNNMRIVSTILNSEAVLIVNPALRSRSQLQETVWRLLRTVTTGIWKTQYTMVEANFLQPLDNDSLARIPSVVSPTISSLQSGGQAIRSLLPVSSLRESLNELYAAGASEVIAMEVQSVFPNLDNSEITRMMRIIYGDNWQLPHPPYSV